MKKAFDNYRYVIGGRRLGGSVWEAPDHLLVVESGGFLMEFVESYKRIDFKNIQTIGYARTNVRTWVTVASLLMIAPAVYWVISGWTDMSVEVFFGLLVGIPALIMLIVNLVKGPTVVFKIQTAVQLLKLKPVKRLSQAQKLAGRLTELCRHHQREMAGLAPLPAVMQAPAAVEQKLKGVKQPYQGSKMVKYGVIILMLAGAAAVGEAFLQNVVYLALHATLAAVAGTLCVAGLARNFRLEMPSALTGALWGAVVNSVLIGIAMYGMLMGAHFLSLEENPSQLRNPLAGGNFTYESFAKMAALDFSTYAWVGWVLIGFGVISLVCGLIGFVSELGAERTALAARALIPPLPPVPSPPVVPATEATPPPPEL